MIIIILLSIIPYRTKPNHPFIHPSTLTVRQTTTTTQQSPHHTKKQKTKRTTRQGKARQKMVILSLLILNKAGGLIFQRDFNEGLKKLSSNDYLVLAGTFHGVHAITSRISPVRDSGGGLEVLESDRFRMQCFQTLTGVLLLCLLYLLACFTLLDYYSYLLQLPGGGSGRRGLTWGGGGLCPFFISFFRNKVLDLCRTESTEY